jgi:hypothetical protein
MPALIPALITTDLALAERYIQSKHMAATAEEYFSSLSVNIPEASRNAWEREIQDAEANRLSNPAGMDILGSRVNLATDRTVEPEDSIASPIELVINMALAIEERQ